MSYCLVERTSPADSQARQVYIVLDGKRAATLLFGKSAAIELPAGAHTLVADNTWNKRKIEFDLRPGDTARFQIVSRAGWGFNWLVGVVGAAPMYVSIERLS